MIRHLLMCGCSWSIALFCLMCTPAVAQVAPENSIHDVDVCELLQHPESYDAQVVRFRGQLNFEFEGAQVNDDPCGLAILHTGTWWNFGGERVSVLARKAKDIQAMTSPVIRDAQFAEFEARAHELRKVRPDGEPCYSHHACAYYNLVATFTGRFFAGEGTPRRIRQGGYGHMGCCYLFVIEQISDVDATRTPVPVEDATFSCATDAWQSDYIRRTAQGIGEHLAANKQFLAEQMRAHGDESLVEPMKRELSPFADLTGTMAWSSPDLLTTYKIHFPQTRRLKHERQQEAQPSTTIVVDVSREHCEPLVN